MRRLKAIVKSGAAALGRTVFATRLRGICLQHPGKPLLLVDIDNTIADTHGFERKNPGRKIQLHQLEPLEPVRAWLLAQADTHTIVYLSARLYWHYNTTKRWLLAHGFPLADQHLILVPGPAHKLPFLRQAVASGRAIQYIDDLSYLDRSGTVQVYEKELEAIRKLPLTYLDLHFIESLLHPVQDAS